MFGRPAAQLVEDNRLHIYEGIGMSEGAPYANNPAVGKRKVLSVGLPPPETDVEIVDLETGTRVMPAYERGEIRVRGPQMVSSYRNRPEETAKTIRDGWLYTGDIGYFDDEGYLFVVDRKKELIISGGYNIHPREVDEVLNSHPDTLEVATVGMKDTFRGEIPVAFVVLKPGRNVSAEELSRTASRVSSITKFHADRVPRCASQDRSRKNRQAEASRFA